MAVPKTTESGCGDGSVQADMIYKDYTSNPIPTPFLLQTAILNNLIAQPTKSYQVYIKKDVGMGVLV